MPKEEIQTQKPKSELPVSFVSPGSLRISGSLTRDTVAGLWRRADIPTGVDGRVVLDASGVTACDSAGLALLVMLNGKVRDAGLALEVSGLR
jgi:ABC-type transporter Mla MlaB component